MYKIILIFFLLFYCVFGENNDTKTELKNLQKEIKELQEKLTLSQREKAKQTDTEYMKKVPLLPNDETKLEYIRLLATVGLNDIKKAKEYLDENPELINYRMSPNNDLISITLFDVERKKFIFNEKMFDLLISRGRKLYNDEFLPLAVVINPFVSDEKTIEILKIFKKEGFDLAFKDFRAWVEDGDYRGFESVLATVTLDMEAIRTNKAKTFKYLVENGGKSKSFGFLNEKNEKLYPFDTLIGTNIMTFFSKNNASFNKVTATPKALEFSKTQKYKDFINTQFEFIEVYVRNGGELISFDLVERFLSELGDENSLKRLENLGIKLQKENNPFAIKAKNNLKKENK